MELEFSVVPSRDLESRLEPAQVIPRRLQLLRISRNSVENEVTAVRRRANRWDTSGNFRPKFFKSRHLTMSHPDTKQSSSCAVSWH